MRNSRLMCTLMMLCVLATSLAAENEMDKAIAPFARNVQRVVQDFALSHARKHQRPEKFVGIPTRNSDVSLLWASTFDESYGCIFGSVKGRFENLLEVGYNAQGEHVDVAFRNHVMIVTRSDNAGNIVGAEFYHYDTGKLEPLDFVMQVVDGNELYFNSKGKTVKPDKVQKELDRGLKKHETAEVANSQTLQWIPFRKIGNYIDAQEDITLSQLPVLVYASYKNNEFATHAARMLDASSYSHIIFKKQVGEVSLKRDNGGAHVYSLNDPSSIKTMFRGYKDNELFPILATSEYLTTHKMMPFSRWKHPEKVVPMERDKQEAVADYYGGRAIKSSRWLANMEESDRKLYVVEFKPQAGVSLAVIVCFIGNKLESTFEQWAVAEPGRNWLWTPGDKGSFMNALPELQGLALTDEGFELYMSQMVGDKRHMIVLREVSSMFIELIDQEF